jgi:hypothetical protein
MSARATPDAPAYRITLFYGPERAEGPPSRLHCVFNVKKRSWKGGVQVSVELDQSQVARARQAADFDAWLRDALAGVAAEEREDYAARAQDLFVQGLCAAKLDLALDGLRQENATLGRDVLAAELDRAVPAQVERLKAQILAELDLPPESAER